MWEIIEKYFMQVVKYILVEIFAWCQLQVSVIFLWKLCLLCFQPDLYLCLRWIPRSQNPLLYSLSLNVLLSDLALFWHVIQKSHILNPILFQPTENITICWFYILLLRILYQLSRSYLTIIGWPHFRFDNLPTKALVRWFICTKKDTKLPSIKLSTWGK